MIDGWELLTRLKKLHWMLDEGSPVLYIVTVKSLVMAATIRIMAAGATFFSGFNGMTVPEN
ncbi:hypothetical protein [Pararhizobium qamdonense]|uniref:hypothetical protein n=1 Tax=Pararhizobium qamdonense TaxID=3031126 RepID=UPI0023E1A7DB|nr:hypothetical protein [Pararhizobium qamdonense]